MATSNDNGATVSGVASSLGDNNSALNTQKMDMHVSGSSAPVTSKSLMPTSQMSVRELLNMETMATSVAIDSSSSVGTVLYSTPVGPSALVSSQTTRVAWMSSMFKYWRGTFRFSFVTTKTILQQTKIMCVFVPGANLKDTPPEPDTAYYYTHKCVFNPANETVPDFVIPFVSEKPYLSTTESVGMFYMLLYQPIVASFDTSTSPADIFIKVFVAANLDMHETIPLPLLATPSNPVWPDDLLWALALTGTDECTAGALVSQLKLVCDDSATVDCPVRTIGFDRPVDIEVPWKPLCALYATNPFTDEYSPSNNRTLFGTPVRGKFYKARAVFVPTVTGTDSINCVGISVAGDETCCFIGPQNYLGGGAAYSAGIVTISRNLQSLFLNPPFFSERDASDLVNIIAEWRALKACGSECSIDCQCPECGGHPYACKCSECSSHMICSFDCTCYECKVFDDNRLKRMVENDEDVVDCMGYENPCLYLMRTAKRRFNNNVLPLVSQIYSCDFYDSSQDDSAPYYHGMFHDSIVILASDFPVSAERLFFDPLDKYLRFPGVVHKQFIFRDFAEKHELIHCFTTVRVDGEPRLYQIYFALYRSVWYVTICDDMSFRAKHLRPFLDLFDDDSSRRSLSLIC